MEALIYKYYSDNNMSSDSASFGRCLKNSNKPSIIAGTFSEMKQVDTLLTGYRTIALTYVNLHIKIPRVDADTIYNVVMPGNLFKLIDWYVFTRTNKHAVANEIAARYNTSSTFLLDIVRCVREARYPFVSFISNNNDDEAERPLIVDYILQTSGSAFKTYIDQYLRRPAP